MKILCIAASNVRKARENSSSTKIGEMVKEMILAEVPQAEVQIMPLLDYDLKPCEMCGGCYHANKCVMDDDFNEIYTAFESTDGIIIVTPHYALAPAKLVMLLEKIQERGYFAWITKEPERFTLAGKPLAVIGHGGSSQNFENLYRRNLLDGVGGAFEATGFRIIGAGEEWKNGVIFGIQKFTSSNDPLQPHMVHDWAEVQTIIAPLVANMVKTLSHERSEGK